MTLIARRQQARAKDMVTVCVLSVSRPQSMQCSGSALKETSEVVDDSELPC